MASYNSLIAFFQRRDVVFTVFRQGCWLLAQTPEVYAVSWGQPEFSLRRRWRNSLKLVKLLRTCKRCQIRAAFVTCIVCNSKGRWGWCLYSWPNAFGGASVTRRRNVTCIGSCAIWQPDARISLLFPLCVQPRWNQGDTFTLFRAFLCAELLFHVRGGSRFKCTENATRFPSQSPSHLRYVGQALPKA